MADFTIEKPVLFTVEGVNGDIYELPLLRNLDADQIEGMADISKLALADKLRAVRKFLVGLCPELEDEPLSDMGYMSLFNALAEGSGITMGE